jgi:hypothetical protein
MSNIIPVPSLSLDGWVTATASKADYLISHFFLADKSQSQLYKSEVSSLQYIIQANGGDMVKTSVELRTALVAYFARYFGPATVDTSFVQDSANSSKVTISIYVSFTDPDGHEFVLARLVDLLDSKIQKITDLNNNGPTI